MRSRPYFDADDIELASLVEAEYDVIKKELAAIVERDGSFKQVELDEFHRSRHVGGFLQNQRELCRNDSSGTPPPPKHIHTRTQTPHCPLCLCLFSV